MSVDTIKPFNFLTEFNLETKVKFAELFDELFNANTAPVAGAKVVIHGAVYLDMYDGQPGLAYFTRDSKVSVDVPAFIEVDELKKLALDSFADKLKEYRDDSEAYDCFDGMFSPKNVTIYNLHNEVMFKYDKNDLPKE